MTRNNTRLSNSNTLHSRLLIACLADDYTGIRLRPRPRITVRTNAVSVIQEEKEENHRTFIMRWNPEISSYRVSDFEQAMEWFCNDEIDMAEKNDFYFDWSVWEYDKVRVGDTFYMVRVGNGNTGIVMKGVITSEPYQGEDWSGQGRDVYYVRMQPDYMFHPDRSKILTTRFLDTYIPDMKWNEGHSGIMLKPRQSKRLEEIWEKYLQSINYWKL